MPPRRPYRRVFLAISRRHLRIRLEAKCIPPFGALPSDIECRATRFVAAGCLPLSKLPYSASREQERLFHSSRPRRLWKTLSQHLSFGATIRALRRRNSSAESAAGMAGAAKKLPLNQPFWRECAKSRGFGGSAPTSTSRFPFVLGGKPEIHLIVRVADTLGGVIVAGLNVVMERRKCNPLQPGFPRCAAV